MKYKVLVNKEHKIKENYLSKIELVTIKDIDNNDIQIEKETYTAYLKLAEFLKSKNITIGISSAYRSKDYQASLYDEFTTQYGKEYADKIVAPVGHSEHHTGLAIDININVNGTWPKDNNDLMNQESELKKVHQYLAQFGFILRYPKGKENITGYPYEPWHFRYVTPVVATIIAKENYTLEEYLNNYSGIIIVNKKQGITSFDVVNTISKTLGIKRVGHTGTLDPLATGVLVVTIGKATKIGELLTATYKEYEAGVLLGVETDTLDITGTIQKTKIVPDNLPIEKVLTSFKKTYLQEVPIYSAVKVNGKKLYEYARQNKEVVLPEKEVTIKEIELLATDRNTFTFRTVVSKGCYIRSLIRDIGKSLDTYASMTNLIRTKQGKFSLAEATTLENIEQGNYTLHKIEDILDYPKIILDSTEEFKVRTGQILENTYHITDKVIFLSKTNELLGIYELKDEKLHVWKNFV